MDAWFILPASSAPPLDALSTSTAQHAPVRLPLALSPHIALGASLLSCVGWVGWVHLRAARRRRRALKSTRNGSARGGDDGEEEPLLGDATESEGCAAREGEGQAATGHELLLELVKVLVAAALLGLSVAKLVATDEGEGEGRWGTVLDGGVVGVAAWLALTSTAKLLDERVEELVRAQQIFLALALSLITLIANVYPFAFVDHPPLSASWRIGMAQAGLSLALGVLLLLAPPRWTAKLHGVSPNPAQTASPLSRLFFSFLEPRMLRYYILTTPWLCRVFRLGPSHSSGADQKGKEGKAEQEQPKVDFRPFVPPLPDVLHSEYILRRFRWEGDSPREDFDSSSPTSSSEREEKKKEGPTMGTARQFAWHHRWEVFRILTFATGWIIFIFVSPLSMNLLLRYVQSSTSPPYNLSPYTFVLLIFLAPIAQSVCYQGALYSLAQLGLRLRALLGHAVYAKLLRVMAGGGGAGGGEGEEDGKADGEGGGKKKKEKGKGKQEGAAAGGNEAVGRVNNLVGTDVDTITSALPSALQLFGVLPKLVISLIALYFLLGWSAFVALGAILLFAPVSRLVAGRYGAVQGEIMKATDKRITLVQELLNSIRILKMFGWEKPSMKRIAEARDLELERITTRAKVYAGMMLLSTGIPAVVTLSTFGAFVFLQKETLTASTAFTAMSLFGLLREAVISATYLLSAFMRARVSLERITHFIADTEELDPSPRTFTRVSPSPSAASSASSSPRQNGKQNGSAKEQEDAAIVVAPNSEFRFSRYGGRSGFKLTTSSLKSGEHGGELRIPRGQITLVAGDVGSGKSAFLMALLGEMHVQEGGNEVFVQDEQQEGGKKDGGRKEEGRVKVSYAAQSPWLQDTSIRNNILFGEEYDEERYNEVIFACGLEDDIDALPEGDETQVGEKGLSLSGGQKQRVALARAVYSHSSIVLLDDVLSALDTSLVGHVCENALNGPLLEGRTVILVTHFVKLCVRRLTNCDTVVQIKDGKVVSAGPPSLELAVEGGRNGRSPSQGSRSSSRSGGSSRSRLHQAHVKHGSGDGAGEEKQDESGDGLGWSVYRRYASAMGGWRFWAPYAVVNVVAHVFMLAQGWYIGHWVNAPDRRSHAASYYAIYAGIQLVSSVSLTAMYLALIWGAIRASRLLHRQLTSRVFAAPFRWWDRTPLGAVTNRFSKDTEILDTEQVENLQPVLDYSVQVAFVAVIISAILPVFLLPATVIAFIFFCVGNLYIRNALAARKEVASSRSPLFSTLGDTTSGVTTIRAFGREEAFTARYKRQTDTYNKAQLYEEGLDRWLEERSDMVGAAVSFVVGLLCLSSGLSSGVTGFLISTGLEFTSRILYVVRAVNKNELSMNSVQRIVQYSTEVETEEPHEDKKEPPAHWPDSGAIEFENFSARYTEDGDDVLHDLSFSIKAGEKIGIVGPSGCGKSSLSLALLRFIIKSSGSITIDGRALDKTNLDAIRSRMTLVPQDPTLFSGTLRSNLDPNDEHDDATLWNAIKRSGFIRADGDEDRQHISLDTPVASSGSNFSQGQRQLIGLARALVRGSRIIILDEATASLDNESDALVQKVIREEFDGATNITVAHRLESVIDYDRILVMRAGKVVEFNTPRTLLDKEDGVFREMVEATGNLDELYATAKEAESGGKRGRK
ncbi:hypothetical protein JCM10213_007656 [Rhodosporidiobolus nylandii]